MSLLSTIQKPKDRPIIATICGEAGVGKTSLAAAFPKPIVIRVEDGLQAIPVSHRPDAFPDLVEIEDQLTQMMMALIHEPHEYQTVIIDSVTKLDTIFIEEVLRRDGKARSINQAMGGYGAGMNMVASMHHRLRKGAGILNDRRGMHVVFVAHADVSMMKTPDADDYMRWSLRMNDKCVAPESQSGFSIHIRNAPIIEFAPFRNQVTLTADLQNSVGVAYRIFFDLDVFDVRINTVRNEVRSVEVRAAEVRAAEVRAAEVRAAEVRAAEVRSVEVRAAEVRSVEVRAAEVRSVEVRAAEVRSVEVRAAEVRSVEVRAAEVRSVEVRAAEVRSVEVRAAEVRSVEVRAAEVRSVEVRAAEVRAAEVRAAEIRAAEVRF